MDKCRTRLKILAITVIIVIAASSGRYVYRKLVNTNDVTQGCSSSEYRADKSRVNLTQNARLDFLEVARTETERARGLSGRSCIGQNFAMLFEFPTPGKYGFWMKDMKFPIDIIWLDTNKKIVDIEYGVPPDSYPKTFYPESDALYVIEMNANLARSWNFVPGTQLAW